MIPVYAGADPSPELRQAVQQGGGELVDVGRAEVVIWEDHTGTGLAEALEHAGSARWVQLCSAGVDWIFEQSLYSPAYTWTCAKGDVFADSVAEMAVLLLLSGFREMRRYIGADRRWLPLAGKPLFGSTVCVVGGGGVGSAVTRLLAPFDCRVTVVRRSTDPVPGAAAVVPQSRLLEVLADSDATVLAAPLTAQTRRMIDAAAFDAMKPGAWLVNVARGRLVDTEALLAALDSGRLGGAALDVTDPEPLPSGHPLWAHPRVSRHAARRHQRRPVALAVRPPRA